MSVKSKSTPVKNYLVDRCLNNPLTFQPAKYTETEQEDRPSEFIFLSKKATSKDRQVHKSVDESSSLAHESTATEMRPKPKSMAEAVAAYTGKKFLSKKEKRALKRPNASTRLVDSDAEMSNEDVGEAINMDGAPAEKHDESFSDSNYESASEFLNDADMSAASKSENASHENSQETSEDDASFIDEEGSEGSSSSESSDSSSRDGDDDDNSSDSSPSLRDDLKRDAQENVMKISPEDRDETESSKTSVEDRDGQDIIGNREDKSTEGSKTTVEAQGQDINKASTTPPTSPEENDATKTVETESKSHNGPDSKLLDMFFKFNEKYDERGSNNSGRIHKSWRELSKQKPLGLLNQGVTCYMNSAIQSLIHVPAVQHYLNEVSSGKYNAVLKPRSVTHVLADLSKRMWGIEEGKHKQAKYINPKKIISRLDDINCMMSEWQQEDSHEYYMSLVSRLQEDSTPKGSKLNKSIIYDIFGGLLSQKITCFKCHNVSETKQEFYDLCLGFNKKKQMNHSQYSVERSISDFFSNEVIKVDRKEKGSGYFCERCKQNTTADKISKIERAPETLTIQLKRFKFDGNSSSKVKHAISYPDYLDVGEYTTDGTPTLYKLISIIVHEGRSISSGHYISHCLQPDGSWSTYDDEYINRLNEQQALHDPSAYVLVYSKLTPKTTKRQIANDVNGPPTKKIRT